VLVNTTSDCRLASNRQREMLSFAIDVGGWSCRTCLSLKGWPHDERTMQRKLHRSKQHLACKHHKFRLDMRTCTCARTHTQADRPARMHTCTHMQMGLQLNFTKGGTLSRHYRWIKLWRSFNFQSCLTVMKSSSRMP